MSDVIATVWDFGKTLIPGYMQDPIFKHYGVEAAAFWKENSDEIEALQKKRSSMSTKTPTTLTALFASANQSNRSTASIMSCLSN
ncbi:hypothetical protein [Sutterella sp.]|uniref:hypothetical protein n=1 Tax=Sutterella sp. TaxID=1981025 RepID=UPI002845B4AF|nr:hypothetical protein [Sutterella sp.]MDR3967473.1 hypothetical protein [Sutterella sp.]